MEKYYKEVIGLYKEALTKKPDDERLIDLQKRLSNAIIRARITGEPTSILEELKSDVDYLKYSIA